MSARVVLVDDVADLRLLVRAALQLRGGFDVVGEAADGNAAVALVASERPDVVVLDLGLPDLAGEEVITRIRQAVPQCQIVVFTGLDGDRADALRGRVAGVVGKDAAIDYLVDLLEDVTGRTTRSAMQALPAELESARRARQFVQARCEEWLVAQSLDDTLLVVSELVTNAVMHARSSCEVTLLLTGTALRVEVADRGTGSPDPLRAEDDDEHGRGLFLVAALSSAWGIDAAPSGAGKVVWAELPLGAASDRQAV